MVYFVIYWLCLSLKQCVVTFINILSSRKRHCFFVTPVSLALREVHHAAVNNPPVPDISLFLSQIISLHQTARLKLLRLPPATLLQPTVAFPEELRWEQWETSPFHHPPLPVSFHLFRKRFSPFVPAQICCDRQMKPDTEHSDWSDEENTSSFSLFVLFLVRSFAAFGYESFSL